MKLNTDSRAVYKPTYSGSHIKATTVQQFNLHLYLQSVMQSISWQELVVRCQLQLQLKLWSKGISCRDSRKCIFTDDVGYITHIVPPKEFSTLDKTVEFQTLDIATTVGVTTTTERLYLKDQTNPSVKPENVLDGYRIGAGTSDRLHVLIPIQQVLHQNSVLEL